MQTPSEYAKSIGWRSLSECERYLGTGNSLYRTWLKNPVKFRALVRGGWMDKQDGAQGGPERALTNRESI